MKRSTQNTRKGIRTFTPEDESYFLEKLERCGIAGRTLNYEMLMRECHIEDHPEIREFLGLIRTYYNTWQDDEQGTVIKSASTHPSRCMACEYGRNVRVYEYQYQNVKAPGGFKNVVRGTSVGILCVIEDGVLLNLQVCNAFLTQEEMNEVKA